MSIRRNARRTALLALALSGAALVPAAAGAAPRWVRLSFGARPESEVVVTWTDDAAGGGKLEYRLPGAAALAEALATTTATGASALGTTYAARATGLQPATEYEYRVMSNGNTGAWHRFRTAPRAFGCAPLRLVAVGDSRGSGPIYVPSGWDVIADAIAAERPLATLHSGDFVFDGESASQWASELGRTERLSRVAPFHMVMGNHDPGPGEGAGANFNRLFTFPADGPDAVDDYGSFVVGNVLVVGLSTYTYSMDAQIDWLWQLLRDTADKVDWRIVVLHTPVWSSGGHGDNEDDRARAGKLVPVLDAWGVELVLAGHDHQYERFHPSKGGAGLTARRIVPLPHDGGRRGTPDGTVYVVSGGGGAAPGIDLNPPGEGSAHASRNLHYLVLDAEPRRLTMTVRDCDSHSLFHGPRCGGAIETVVLEKPYTLCSDAPDPPDAGPDAGPADAGAPDAGGADAGADAGDEPDAGPARADAGPEELPRVEGCGCGAAPSAALLLALLPWRRRRRSR